MLCPDTLECDVLPRWASTEVGVTVGMLLVHQGHSHYTGRLEGVMCAANCDVSWVGEVKRERSRKQLDLVCSQCQCLIVAAAARSTYCLKSALSIWRNVYTDCQLVVLELPC